MELCYRGTYYQSKSLTMTAQKSGHPIVGKYRGATLRLNTLTQKASPQAPLKLTYRGTNYLR